MEKYTSAANVAVLMFATIALPAAASGVCNNSYIVGGGTLGVSPSAGAGWNVGSGQCNGDFTVVTDPLFPGGALELGMRIEQRSAGQLNPPQHAGINYEVQKGSDTTQPNGARAWWNFQHSIAYNGGIANLDKLTFVIRRDVGTDLPATPFTDMLAVRSVIDDRPTPKTTATYSDLYQTSQNPVFGWFSPTYSLTDSTPGAWMLTLAAVKAGRISSVSICAHTPTAVCNAAPIVYTCTDFEAPLDKAISAKKANRVLPLKMVCTGANGVALGAGDIAAPVVRVTKTSPSNEETAPADTYLSAGQGTDTNQFVFNGARWVFNLQTKNFTGTGTYAITAVGGGGNVIVGGPTGVFVVQ
jgi:hypothetical protein